MARVALTKNKQVSFFLILPLLFLIPIFIEFFSPITLNFLRSTFSLLTGAVFFHVFLTVFQIIHIEPFKKCIQRLGLKNIALHSTGIFIVITFCYYLPSLSDQFHSDIYYSTLQFLVFIRLRHTITQSTGIALLYPNENKISAVKFRENYRSLSWFVTGFGYSLSLLVFFDIFKQSWIFFLIPSFFVVYFILSRNILKQVKIGKKSIFIFNLRYIIYSFTAINFFSRAGLLIVHAFEYSYLQFQYIRDSKRKLKLIYTIYLILGTAGTLLIFQWKNSLAVFPDYEGKRLVDAVQMGILFAHYYLDETLYSFKNIEVRNHISEVTGSAKCI